MKRRIFTILAAVSLVLCVGLVVVCLASYKLGPWYLNLSDHSIFIRDGRAEWTWWAPFGGQPKSWSGLGITLRWRPGTNSWLLVPLAYPVAAAAILPIVSLHLWLRHRRLHPPGHCHHCGYDLRASKDKCPECGEAIAAKA